MAEDSGCGSVHDTGAMPSLSTRPLCVAEFEVAGGIVDLGTSPFGSRRVGYITGGRFFGDRLSGIILPGGGNWSHSGRAGDTALGTFDARSVWQAEDGSLIHVSYGGRSAIPDGVRRKFADNEAVDRSEYYLRIAPVFETAATNHSWLNGILAIGVGERTEFGVRHMIHEVL